MNSIVSIIMGSTSDLPVMEKAAKFLDEMEIPFEMNACEELDMTYDQTTATATHE